MLKPPPRRLLHAVRSLSGSAVGEGSDGDLLGRFAEFRDEAAFEELLRRHADMVWRVCRRHLGSGPDADDAFQAVFLVLARDAARIGRRESLPGWLFRVAYHVSRKLMGQLARQRILPVRDLDAPLSGGAPDVDQRELRAVVDEEVGALPDHLRSAVVLCYFEGRSNSEAAAILGVPKGTVDSRLAAARKRLHRRLLSRGVAVSGGLAFETLWSGEVSAVAPGLSRRVLEAVTLFARTGSPAGAVSQEVLSLVAGVAPTMSTHRLTLIAAAAVLVATLGGTGVTVFQAQADGKKPPEAAKAEPTKPAAKPAEPATLGAPPATSNETVARILKQPLNDLDLGGELTFRDFLALVQERFGVLGRIDLAACQRVGVPNGASLYDQRISVPATRGMTLTDALRDALAQLTLPDGGDTPPFSWRIRNGQLAIVPAFRPTLPSVGAGPAQGGEETLSITPSQQLEQVEGEPISITVDEKSLLEVLRELRQTTGVNIVLDMREKKKAETPVTASLHDVRLMAALRVLGDMCDLQPVALNNVFYLTSKENAAKLQREIDQRRYGNQSTNAPAVPGGLGSDAVPPKQP